MATRQYIGMRYVPIIKGTWSVDEEYEPFTVVTYQGNSYTSKKFVPGAVEPTNTEYWALTGNYNAQVEQYRQETAAAAASVAALAESVEEDIEQLQGEVAADIAEINAYIAPRVCDVLYNAALPLESDHSLPDEQVALGALTLTDYDYLIAYFGRGNHQAETQSIPRPPLVFTKSQNPLGNYAWIANTPALTMSAQIPVQSSEMTISGYSSGYSIPSSGNVVRHNGDKSVHFSMHVGSSGGSPTVTFNSLSDTPVKWAEFPIIRLEGYKFAEE